MKTDIAKAGERVIIDCDREVVKAAIGANDAAMSLLLAASAALRSYQYGNSSPDLAKEIADTIEEFLKP